MCKINDCEASVLARQMCSKHYSRWWRTGYPEGRRHRKVDGVILTAPYTKNKVVVDA